MKSVDFELSDLVCANQLAFNSSKVWNQWIALSPYQQPSGSLLSVCCKGNRHKNQRYAYWWSESKFHPWVSKSIRVRVSQYIADSHPNSDLSLAKSDKQKKVFGRPCIALSNFFYASFLILMWFLTIFCKVDRFHKGGENLFQTGLKWQDFCKSQYSNKVCFALCSFHLFICNASTTLMHEYFGLEIS